MPQRPVCQLAAHEASVNCVQWAPHSSCHLCTGAEDAQALIWDISCIPKPVEGA
jgi:WD repeat-containing protein 68